jgi:thymidine phosphorylase
VRLTYAFILTTFIASAGAARDSQRVFQEPCAKVYAKALNLGRARYHDVIEVSPGQTLEMKTGSQWKNGELTITVHFTTHDPDGCTIQAASLSRGPILKDAKTFIERLSKE